MNPWSTSYIVVYPTRANCSTFRAWDELVEHLYTVVYDIRQHFGAV